MPNAASHQTARDELRLLEFEFLRAAEMAALNCRRYLGAGNKHAADAAACNAIRGVFNLTAMRGEVVIGEGIKDQAPGLMMGERVGSWTANAPRCDIAIDPLDGTTNLAQGLPNALSCIAAALRSDEEQAAMLSIPAFYMKKLSYPAAVRRAWLKDDALPIDVNAPLGDVISATAKILGKSIREVVVMVLDRPRNLGFIEAVRSAGASLRTITDGDIAAAIAPAMPNSGVDLYVGIGGAPEGVLAAAGLRCLRGGMQAQMWFRDDRERTSLLPVPWGDRADRVYRSCDLVSGHDILFVATGVSESPFLPGLKIRGSTVVTHSILMHLRGGTVRRLTTRYELSGSLSLMSGNAQGQPAITRVKTAPNLLPSPSDEREGVDFEVSPPSYRPSSKAQGVVLFGPPGCGKGTIGKALAQLPGFIHCSSGDVIRSAQSEGGREAERLALIAEGALISDEDLWRLFDLFLDRTLSSPGCSRQTELMIIDGIPRCKAQACELSKRVDVHGVFYLECKDPATLITRLRGRFAREARSDDANERVIRERLRLFEETTLPILDDYPAGIVHRIEADQAPWEVLHDVLAKVNSLKRPRRPLAQRRLVAARSLR